MKTILNGIINENPILVLLLGLCSTLAVTTNFENAYIMGICVIIILTFSNITVSLIRKLVPKNVEVPVYILIISTFVTILEILLEHYTPALYKVLGIYLPLIVVNCIVLGRALSVASKTNVRTSFLDAVGIGLGYTLILMLIAAFREIFGNNTITFMNSISNITGYKLIYKVFPDNNLIPFNILIKPAGAFLTLGFLLFLFNLIKGGKKDESN